jgi:hypothetical protein
MTQHDVYDKVAGLVSKIRNARYGEMVRYLEALIDSGDWRDFTTPVGTRFQFLECEFDYFLLAMDVDPTLIRHAYAHAKDVEALSIKELRLADITGRGKFTNAQRRSRDDIVSALDSDPSGAGARIKAATRESFVSERIGRIAKLAEVRAMVSSGKRIRNPSARHTWRVEWADTEKPAAQAITDKLLADPELANDVYKRLDSARNSREYQERKRRSGVENE